LDGIDRIDGKEAILDLSADLVLLRQGARRAGASVVTELSNRLSIWGSPNGKTGYLLTVPAVGALIAWGSSTGPS
jgi:hypothetical protein